MELARQIVLDPVKNLISHPADIRAKLDHYRALSNSGLSKLSAPNFEALREDAFRFFNVIAELRADTYPPRIFRVSFNQGINGAPRKRLTKISELIGPPVGLTAKYGRASLPGESVFYGALDPITALWETKPKKGDYITLSEWTIRPGERLNVHWIFHPEKANLSKESQEAFSAHLRMQEQLYPLNREVFSELFKFFTEEFMKSEIKDHPDYLFSAICGSNIIRPPRPAEGQRQTDAVVYPSVQRALGVSNVAIANDVVLNVLKPIALTIYDVAESYYDTMDPGSGESPIGVGPAQIRVTEFDEASDTIINPDAKDEMSILINAHMKSKGKRGTVTFRDGSEEVLGADSVDQAVPPEKS